MSVPMTVAATIRGRAAFDEVRALFDQLYLIDSDIAHLDENLVPDDGITEYRLTEAELRHALQNRRDAVLNKLENKGIRIAPDPAPVAPAMAVIETGVMQVPGDAVLFHTDIPQGEAS
ncbi:hypothetical protein SAMN04487785_102422 [Dyella jiangningensis]|uniref:hypothetical protein n=1 Tax=Dyella sp. AtDHG13 TaxID=1938897 RepID=UPI00088C73CC|nr:hypothetical protein [Dyella sp. AtDHG13]PXV60694.1 hypothetical protein BDW41_102421 [Dyella sp. AtDHG13]SDJ55441.1 hypothetical protein SAMN04487785_102422 [Dyella jiangningensis]